MGVERWSVERPSPEGAARGPSGLKLQDMKIEVSLRKLWLLVLALALVRADANEGFIGDLLDIGVDERERIQSARGVPLPCAVLDQSGTPLPIDVSAYGIKRFDLGSDAWKAEFGTWLAQVRRTAAGGPL